MLGLFLFFPTPGKLAVMHVYGIISIHGNEWADERTLKQAQQNFFAGLAQASFFIFRYNRKNKKFVKVLATVINSGIIYVQGGHYK